MITSSAPHGLPAIAALAAFCLASPGLAEFDLAEGGSTFHDIGGLTYGRGSGFDFLHHVKNVGDEEAPPAIVEYYLSLNTVVDAGDYFLGGVELEKIPLATEEPDGMEVIVDLEVPNDIPGGIYRLVWKIDAGEDAKESNVSNNWGIYQHDIEIIAPTLFNLADDSPDPGHDATTLSAGSTFYARSTVTNLGPQISSSFSVNWVLSDDTIIGDADDILLATISQSPLSPPIAGFNQPRVINRHLTIPSNTAPGSYRVGYQILAPGDYLQSNNSMLLPGTITLYNSTPGLVDLGPALLPFSGVSNEAPTNADPFEIFAFATNTGDTASGSYTIRYYASADNTLDTDKDTLLMTYAQPSLAPGEMDDLRRTVNASPLTPGTTYQIFIRITDGNDDFPTNNIWRVGEVTPVAGQDVELLGNWELLEENATSSSGYFHCYPDEVVRYRGSLRNNSASTARVTLSATWDHTHSSRSYVVSMGPSTDVRLYETAFSATDPVPPWNGIGSSQILIPPGETKFVDVGIPLGEHSGGLSNDYYRFPGGRIDPFGAVFGWATANENYNVTVKATVVSGTDIVPANNSTQLFAGLNKFIDYNLGMTQSNNTAFVSNVTRNPNGSVTVSVDADVYAFRYDPSGGRSPATSLRLYINDAPYGTAVPVPAMPSGETSEIFPVTLTETIPSSFTPGLYDLSVRLADGGEALWDDRRTVAGDYFLGTEATSDLTDGGSGFHDVPDTIPFWAAGPSGPLLGFRVTNTGTAVPQTSVVRVYLSADANLNPATDIAVGSGLIPTLAANGHVNLEIEIEAPSDTPTGEYHLGWILDADGDITEASESNNTVFLTGSTVFVGETGNLQAGSSIPHLPDDPWVAEPGGTMRILGSIANEGIAAGSHFDRVLIADDAAFSSNVIEVLQIERASGRPLNSDQLLALDVPMPIGLAPRTTPYFLGYQLDAGHQVDESDETDNLIVAGSFYVIDPAQFRVIDARKISGSIFHLRWNARPDRSYILQRSQSLAGGWTNYGIAIPGEYPSMSRSLSQSGERWFFRVVEE
ncbi:CARDB domain-containing protein [Haloferula sargassicola]|uniref:CARDB domain-containing protein n=1 Tax=Haloferula sargassicola TaxID=490096 RepID=A0ABP9UKP4_9BACT